MQKITNEKETAIKKAVSFHVNELTKRGFPCQLNESIITQSGSSHFLPSLSDLQLFFLTEGKSGLVELDFPIIKNLVCFQSDHRSLKKLFETYLKNFGLKFLIFLEDYNCSVFDFLKNFQIQETYHWQKKLLCPLNNLSFYSDLRDRESPNIRNFILGRDEEKYTNFYNQVLGKLGSIVDIDFVKKIVSRSSFDPNGYFIAEKENEIVGFFAIEKEPWGEIQNGFGYIYQIGVSDAWQGKGLAERLLWKGFKFADQNNINRIGVGVRGSNHSAIKFFKKHGFDCVYETKAYLLELQK